jgi:hypothetical protein
MEKEEKTLKTATILRAQEVLDTLRIWHTFP